MNKTSAQQIRNLEARVARLERQSARIPKYKMRDQQDLIKKWNRSGDYTYLEKAGLADAYDELYSLVVKEENIGELSSRETKRYVDLYDMLTKHKVAIRFGVNI